MRHGKKWRKLGRKDSHYKLMGRNLIAALFEHERIITTEQKAKEFRSSAEKLITLSREPSLHHYRLVLSRLQNENVVQKLFKEIAPRFKDRPGGYTRIIKLGGSRLEKTKNPGKYSWNRLGDNGRRVIWELVIRKEKSAKAKKAEKETKTKEIVPVK
ncbi:MAG: 50S ribosomal protein L17 [Planctomycetota bacterium]|nr:50S ribosomal protein L17 [Planctomycetota bacterium]MDI6787472.1 50S ribosomal protein L17 [Planctomycetota bacterium]